MAVRVNHLILIYVLYLTCKPTTTEPGSSSTTQSNTTLGSPSDMTATVYTETSMQMQSVSATTPAMKTENGPEPEGHYSNTSTASPNYTTEGKRADKTTNSNTSVNNTYSNTDQNATTASTATPVGSTSVWVSGGDFTHNKTVSASTTITTSLPEEKTSNTGGGDTTVTNKTTPKTDDSDHKSDEQSAKSDSRYLWILLVLVVAVVAGVIYVRFRCFKIQHHSGTMDSGTENASFQRTESNKDGIMLLGVKSGVEENAAAR